jgi:uncharacterized protein YjbJ (UPF0337 family)
MDSSTKDKIEGKATEAKGTVKENVGDALDNKEMEAEGAAERASGKTQDKVGDVKKVFGQ